MFVVTTTVDGVFLSTPSARRATLAIIDAYEDYCSISIHALREEGDLPAVLPAAVLSISIHALREEGDDEAGEGAKGFGISIHALREEGDLQCLVTWSSHRYFYPRPPRGGRL